MPFEAKIHVYQAPIPFKYIEFGFDKVKVHQLLATNIHVPVDTFGNSGKANLETTKSMI